MENMFFNTNLKYLDFSKFNTLTVSNMNKMFAANQVTKIRNMFYNCKSLQSLN